MLDADAGKNILEVEVEVEVEVEAAAEENIEDILEKISELDTKLSGLFEDTATFDLVHDPVMVMQEEDNGTLTGFTSGRETIEEWLDRNNTVPQTGKVAVAMPLLPNPLVTEIAKELAKIANERTAEKDTSESDKGEESERDASEEVKVTSESDNAEKTEKEAEKEADAAKKWEYTEEELLGRVARHQRWLIELISQNEQLGANPDEKLSDVRSFLSIDYEREALNSFSPTLCTMLSCNRTNSVMKDPVMAADGFNYERIAIKDWFQSGNDTSPATGDKLPNTMLVSNLLLKQISREIIRVAELCQLRQVLDNNEINQEEKMKHLEEQFELLNRQVVGLRRQNDDFEGNLHSDKLFDIFLNKELNGGQTPELDNEETEMEKEEQKSKGGEEKEEETEKQKDKKGVLSFMFRSQNPPKGNQGGSSGITSSIKNLLGL